MYSHSSFDGHLVCFHFLVIMNKAAPDPHVQTSMWTRVFISLRYILREELLGHLGSLCLTF